jgi:hypothetical protein
LKEARGEVPMKEIILSLSGEGGEIEKEKKKTVSARERERRMILKREAQTTKE